MLRNIYIGKRSGKKRKATVGRICRKEGFKAGIKECHYTNNKYKC